MNMPRSWTEVGIRFPASAPLEQTLVVSTTSSMQAGSAWDWSLAGAQRNIRPVDNSGNRMNARLLGCHGCCEVFPRQLAQQ
jgi:hypothetical protein